MTLKELFNIKTTREITSRHISSGNITLQANAYTVTISLAEWNRYGLEARI